MSWSVRQAVGPLVIPWVGRPVCDLLGQSSVWPVGSSVSHLFGQSVCHSVCLSIVHVVVNFAWSGVAWSDRSVACSVSRLVGSLFGWVLGW